MPRLTGTLFAVFNCCSVLVDCMVAQLSHRTKEGYGKQRLWGSVAWGLL